MSDTQQLGQEIESIRKGLGLTQKQAADIFGGGDVSFSEYESGKTKPSKSTVILLRLLNKMPGLINEIKSLSKINN